MRRKVLPESRVVFCANALDHRLVVQRVPDTQGRRLRCNSRLNVTISQAFRIWMNRKVVVLYDNHTDGFQSGLVVWRISKMYGPEQIHAIGRNFSGVMSPASMFCYVVGFAKRRVEKSRGIHNQKSGSDRFGIILVRISMKGVEIAKSVSACFAVLGVNRLQFDCDLNERRFGKIDERLCRRLRPPCAGSKCEIYDPVVMADLLVVPELCNDLTGTSALPEDWAAVQQVLDNRIRLPITVSGCPGMIAATGQVSDDLLLNPHGRLP